MEMFSIDINLKDLAEKRKGVNFLSWLRGIQCPQAILRSWTYSACSRTHMGDMERPRPIPYHFLGSHEMLKERKLVGASDHPRITMNIHYTSQQKARAEKQEL